MADHKRYFHNLYIEVERNQNTDDPYDPDRARRRVLQLSRLIISRTDIVSRENLDGGLYLGPAGIAYAFWYLTAAHGENEFLGKKINTENNIYEAGVINLSPRPNP